MGCLFGHASGELWQFNGACIAWRKKRQRRGTVSSTVADWLVALWPIHSCRGGCDLAWVADAGRSIYSLVLISIRKPTNRSIQGSMVLIFSGSSRAVTFSNIHPVPHASQQPCEGWRALLFCFYLSFLSFWHVWPLSRNVVFWFECEMPPMGLCV